MPASKPRSFAYVCFGRVRGCCWNGVRSWLELEDSLGETLRNRICSRLELEDSLG